MIPEEITDIAWALLEYGRSADEKVLNTLIESQLFPDSDLTTTRDHSPIIELIKSARDVKEVVAVIRPYIKKNKPDQARRVLPDREANGNEVVDIDTLEGSDQRGKGELTKELEAAIAAIDRATYLNDLEKALLKGCFDSNLKSAYADYLPGRYYRDLLKKILKKSLVFQKLYKRRSASLL